MSETKFFINLYFFKISGNMLLATSYLLTSIFLNIINRVLYQKYNFKFNFTLLFIQQLFCTLFFKFVCVRFKNFNEKVGEISFQNFNSKKLQYLFFCFLFVCNYLSSFIGNQMVNTAMFLVLRKFLTVMNFTYDLFINKKNLPSYFSYSVILIFLGSIMTGYHDLTSETIGYFIVFLNNFLSVMYGQMSDSFKKKNGISNLNLLVYNSYISTPILFSIIFISGEYKLLMAYQGYSIGFFFWLLLSTFMAVLLNSSYFLSNEANSSLFSQLLSNCKVKIKKILIYFFLGHFYYCHCYPIFEGLQPYPTYLTRNFIFNTWSYSFFCENN
jgi:hypothetical protein